MRFCIVYPRFSIILVHINKDDCGLTKFYHFIGFKSLSYYRELCEHSGSFELLSERLLMQSSWRIEKKKKRKCIAHLLLLIPEMHTDFTCRNSLLYCYIYDTKYHKSDKAHSPLKKYFKSGVLVESNYCPLENLTQFASP